MVRRRSQASRAFTSVTAPAALTPQWGFTLKAKNSGKSATGDVIVEHLANEEPLSTENMFRINSQTVGDDGSRTVKVGFHYLPARGTESKTLSVWLIARNGVAPTEVEVEVTVPGVPAE